MDIGAYERRPARVGRGLANRPRRRSPEPDSSEGGSVSDALKDDQDGDSEDEVESLPPISNMSKPVRPFQQPDRWASHPPAPPQLLVFHRVDCSGQLAGHEQHVANVVFLDPPRLYEGDSGASALRGNQPIGSREEYLRSHPEVTIISWKSYSCIDYHQDMRYMFDQLPLPRADPAVPPHIYPYFDVLRETGQLAHPTNEAIEILPPCQLAMNTLAGQIPSALRGWESHLRAPFLLFYHARSAIRQNIESGLDADGAANATLLIDHIESECSEDWQEADQLFERGLVTEVHLSKLFGPDEIILRKESEEPMALLSRECAESNPLPLQLSCHSWAFDGAFHRERRQVLVDWADADDVEEITSLPVFPLRFDKSGELEARLRARGNMFWACREAKFIEYQDPSPSHEVRPSAPRYMIDTTMYHELHKDTPSSMKDDLGETAMRRAEPPGGPFVLLLPHRMQGFGIHDKKWRNLLVSHFREVNWNTKAFSQLVLEPQKKELIEAMVRIHISTRMTSDIMEGKGNGLILLLHGGPGTGKTLTAESVAELAKKPLYRVTCGDIGTDPEIVEQYLTSVLHIGTAWKAVVLLDESDVFLEEREKSDLQRNALVSVFLRVLEYYEGILILTSNRVGTFDEAFKSRVQLALHYPPLDRGGRKHIWNNFIKLLERSQAEPESQVNGATPIASGFAGLAPNERVNIEELCDNLDLLADVKLNGRQIRNAITTARQLALFNNRPLGYSHLLQTIKAANDFEEYLNRTHGHTDGEFARAARTRLE